MSPTPQTLLLTIAFAFAPIGMASGATPIEDEEYPTMHDVLELIREHNSINQQFVIENVTINGVPISVDSLVFLKDPRDNNNGNDNDNDDNRRDSESVAFDEEGPVENCSGGGSNNNEARECVEQDRETNENNDGKWSQAEFDRKYGDSLPDDGSLDSD